MSWSVSAIGKSSAVAAKLEKEFATMYKCNEPEETVKQAAATAIAAALAGQIPDCAVNVTASGSMSSYTPSNGGPAIVMNSLRIVVEPIHGFVE